jgi:hypothetical protein
MLKMPLLARAEPSISDSGARRQIDCNDEQPESVLPSIRVSFDPNSNVNDESAVPSEKELLPRKSTEAGKQIGLNDE